LTWRKAASSLCRQVRTMPEDPSPIVTRGSTRAGRILGVVLVLVGAAAIGAVIFANAGHGQGAERLAFGLGLAFAPALAAVGLCLVLIGLFALLRVGGRR
jgi:hypothetical protein